MTQCVLLDVLDAVTNLRFRDNMTSSAIILVWEKPVSLNLMTILSQILSIVWMCMTSQKDRWQETTSLVIVPCLKRSIYVFKVDHPDPTHLFNFVVTPRINVEGAKNGTAHSIDGHFSYECKRWSRITMQHTRIFCCLLSLFFAVPKSVSNEELNVLVNITNHKDIQVKFMLNAGQVITGL